MNFRVLDVAQRALDEAVSYYNDQTPGLGDAFLLEAIAAIARVRKLPDAWHPLGEEFHRCLFHGFPYGLIYHVEKAGVLVVAVAHTHRPTVGAT